MTAPAPAFMFHRPKMAAQIADAIMGATPFDYRSGLFLAAPRRTGKSTFLLHDLCPELTSRNVVTIYVDLWSNREKDPGDLLIDAVKQEMRALDNGLVKAARAIGLAKIGVGSWASLDINSIGAPHGATLADAIIALIRRSGSPVAIIVDEAQHALSSEAGVNAMFALKSARDQANMSQDIPIDGPRLMLVFTGSHRDKLASFVLRRDQPFFGASIMDFPMLDRDFAESYTTWLNERLASGNRFNADHVFTAFDKLGRRPEKLQELLKDLAFGLGSAVDLQSAIEDGANDLRERLWEDYDRDYDGLSIIQQAVLCRIVEQGNKFSPFSADSLAAYTAFAQTPIDVPSAQSALEALRQKNIVWRSSRGVYALEDQGMEPWLEARLAADQRPSA